MDSKMSLMLSITTVIVTLISPVVAVQVQKFIKRYTDRKTLKIDIFKQLMATRSQNARLSNEHVRALNMIDIAFYGRVRKGLTSIFTYEGVIKMEIVGVPSRVES